MNASVIFMSHTDTIIHLLQNVTYMWLWYYMFPRPQHQYMCYV